MHQSAQADHLAHGVLVDLYLLLLVRVRLWNLCKESNTKCFLDRTNTVIETYGGVSFSYQVHLERQVSLRCLEHLYLLVVLGVHNQGDLGDLCLQECQENLVHL